MSDRRLDDFRQTIARDALVFDSAEAPIIHAESTGDRGKWLFDFRALMLQGQWLDQYAEIFWERYASRYPFQVGAMETAGIGLVAAIVMKGVERGTPVNGFFMRKSRKRQGLMKRVEGTLTDDPIILVDDLMNTGGTFDKQLLILKERGARVTHIFSILTFRAPEKYARFAEAGVHVDSIFDLTDFNLPLTEEAAEAGTTHEEIWRFSAPHPSLHLVVHKSAPALDDDHVYFGTDAGIFYALDKESGTVAWNFTSGKHPAGKGILSSPAVHKGTVYFGAYDGVVYALDTKNGEMRWKYDDADWVGSSPALWCEKHMLYIGLEYGLFKKRGGIAALDMKSGREIWRAQHTALTHATPLVIPSESLVVIGSNDGVVYAYDALSGELRWRYAGEGDIKMAPAYDVARRMIVVASMGGTCTVLYVDGTPLYAHKSGGAIYGAPSVHDGLAYFASLDKTICAIDLDTFKIAWEFQTNGRIFCSPTIAAGSLWSGSNDGKLYEIDPKNGKLRGSFQASERILTRIAYDEKSDRIYFGTVAGELYCIKKDERLQ